MNHTGTVQVPARSLGVVSHTGHLFLFTFLSVMDYFTTLIGLETGLSEGNPFVAAILEAPYGAFYYFAAKLALVALVVLFAAAPGYTRTKSVAFTVFNVTLTAVVLNNTWLIL